MNFPPAEQSWYLETQSITSRKRNSMTTPNIFSIHSKEFAIDAFLIWITQWADPQYEKINEALNSLAVDVIKLLAGDQMPEEITNVKAWPQEENIDVIVTVNNQLVIAIENKLGSYVHSDQLTRYREYIERDYAGNKHAFVYFKLATEPKENKRQVEQKGYKVLERKELYQTLIAKRMAHPNVEDFIAFMENFLDDSEAWEDLATLRSSYNAQVSFLVALEKRFNTKPTYWDWQNNMSGSFNAFKLSEEDLWVNGYNFGVIALLEIGPQTLRFTIKMWDVDNESFNLGDMYRWVAGLSKLGAERGLHIVKPEKFAGKGNSRTLAVLGSATFTNADGKVDVDLVAKQLDDLSATMLEYFNQVNAEVAAKAVN